MNKIEEKLTGQTTPRSGKFQTAALCLNHKAEQGMCKSKLAVKITECES